MRGIRGEHGLALIGVIVVSALLMSLAVTLSLSVNSDTQLRGAFSTAVSGFYRAEAGLNKGMGDYKNIFLGFGIPYGSDFDQQLLTVNGRETVYQLNPSASMQTSCTSGQTPPCPANVTIPEGEIFGGLNAIQYNYTVNSAAIAGEDVHAAVGAEFLVGYIPLFQFVAFYANDLEIAPGPVMNLNGRVHTNADLYLGGGGGPLNIADNPAVNVFSIQVSAGGDIYRGRKRESQCGDNGVVIDMLDDVVAPFDDLDPKPMSCGSGTSVVPPATLAGWKGSVKAEIQNIAIPQPDIILPGQGVFWQNADLRIVLNINGAVPAFQVQNSAGNVDVALTAQLAAFMNDVNFNQGVGGTGPSSLPGTYPIFYTDVPVNCGNNLLTNCYTPNFASVNRIYTSNMVGLDDPVVAAGGVRDFRRGGFYNWREASWMRLLNVNVTDLLLWNQQNGEPFFATTDSSDGGIVLFLTVAGPNSGPTSLNNYGVRVFGSANLPIPGGIGVSVDPTGITIVSDQAMYVLGDYNRGLVNPGDLPRQPAAFLGDSINVLSSNYWQGAQVGSPCAADPCAFNDSQSNQSLNNVQRNAVNTWINAAFLGGVDTTTPGGGASTYNGGLENYPRFHEDWGGGRALNYQGSFVSLGVPWHVDGPWCGTGGSLTSGCNIYNPPIRNWNFDPAFNNAANLPPLTPRFVYVQQVLFTEDFK